MLKSQLKRGVGHLQAAQAAIRAKLAPSVQSRADAKRCLADRLGRLHGLPQKYGQMLSFSWKTSEPSEFAILQDRAPSTSFDVLQPILESAWKRSLEDVVATLDRQGSSASLSQVHRATLHDGREVAIKIQYPGIRDDLFADLSWLRWSFVPLAGLNCGFDADGYQRMIRASLERELDYSAELAAQVQIRGLADPYPSIKVPDVVREWSSRDVLVTEWVDADRCEVAKPRLSPSQRQLLATSLVEFFLNGLLKHGVMQADWHPGNVRIRLEEGAATWVLYDFGACCQLANNNREALRELLAAPPSNIGAWNLLLALGFDQRWLTSLKPKLAELCEVLLAPFYHSGAFDLSQWRLGERMAEVLGEDRWNFRIAAPPSLLPLFRAFHGVIYYVLRLNIQLDWKLALDKAGIEEKSQRESLRAAPTSLPPPPIASAEFLKVRIQREGETVVLLTFPASVSDRLAALMDEELAAKVRSANIDVDAISRSPQVRKRQPGSLFRLQDSNRLIEVWLE